MTATEKCDVLEVGSAERLFIDWDLAGRPEDFTEPVEGLSAGPGAELIAPPG